MLKCKPAQTLARGLIYFIYIKKYCDFQKIDNFEMNKIIFSDAFQVKYISNFLSKQDFFNLWDSHCTEYIIFFKQLRVKDL